MLTKEAFIYNHFDSVFRADKFHHPAAGLAGHDTGHPDRLVHLEGQIQRYPRHAIQTKNNHRIGDDSNMHSAGAGADLEYRTVSL